VELNKLNAIADFDEEKPKEVDNRSMADLLREKREATEKILEE
jgi:hypothetical protein